MKSTLLADLWLIGWFDVRESLRSRRALTLVGLYLLVATLSAYLFVSAVKALESQLAAATGDAGSAATQMALGLARSEGYHKLLSVFTLGDVQKASYLAGLPPMGLFMVLAMLTLIPWMVALTASDQVAGDLHLRTVRFVALRASRGAFVLGKLLAQVLLIGAVTVGAFVPAIFFGQKDLQSFDASATLLFLLTTAPALLAYAFAFLGLTSLASQLVGTPGRARALTLGLFALLWLAGLPEPSTHTIVGALAYLSPWQLKMGFLAPEAGGRNLTLALALGYGALFTGLGYLTFRRRDL